MRYLPMPNDERLWSQKCGDIRRQLIENHVKILDCLDRIKINLRNYPVAKQSLRVLYETLFHVFSLQSGDFFEFLDQELYRSDVGKMCEFLDVNLREVKIATISFCEDHPADMSDVNPVNFIRDFSVFAESVHARVIAEQQYLIPYLERIIKKYA